MNPRPLEGIMIIEIGMKEAEGIASLLLSDYGARVIRLEILEYLEKQVSLDESESRSRKGGKLSEASLSDQEAPETAGPVFRICDRGKERYWFRPDHPRDQAWFQRLLLQADALITSVPDALMAQWRLDGDTLCGLYPRLVYTSVTGFGQKGPYGERYAYDDAAIQAESGFMSVTGPEGGEPVRSGSDFAAFAGGANACIGTLMALIDARRTGRGRKIDVSMLDSILYGLENQFSIYLKSGRIPGPMGNRYALSAPVGNYLCRDGRQVMISVATEQQWQNFAEVLGHKEWLENPDYGSVQKRLEHAMQLSQDVAEAFLEYDSDRLVELLQTRSCIYGRINNFREVAEHPQTRARRMFVEISAPDGTRMTVPSNPLVIDGAKPSGARIFDTETRLKCVIK